MDVSAPDKDACRLCDGATEEMHSIFEKNADGHQILYLIKQCLPILVYRTDPLPKHVCGVCINKLEALYRFKKCSIDTANKHLQHLRRNEDSSKSIQLYLACEESASSDFNNGSNDTSNRKTSIATSTEDLSVLCTKCKTKSFSSVHNEVELCAELTKALTDSLSNNKVITSDPNKEARTRRRRSQAFYHELDDSLCSSFSEFTNTESSQNFEEDYNSDMDSYDSESERRPKRRKLDSGATNEIEAKEKETDVPEPPLLDTVRVTEEMYKDEVEHRYDPLRLMSLALNVINQNIIKGYETEGDFYVDVVEPRCTYCKEGFKNSKLLSLHEIQHINIELGEKVDNPIPWHESRDDADIRNKWLNRFDDLMEEDGEEEDEEEGEMEEEDMVNMVDFADCEVEEVDDDAQSLLIPVGSSKEIMEHEAEDNEEGDEEEEEEVVGEIELLMTKPMVNGVALADYSKQERKAFYKTMRIGGVNKKFCSLCRYSFKDNWAIESHYFSSACYYTCRYCGMRFNKNRHIFQEHVSEHEDRGDNLSTSIYCASKMNNVVPRVIQPEKVKRMVAQHDQDYYIPKAIEKPLPRERTREVAQPTFPPPTLRARNEQEQGRMRTMMQRRSLQTNIKIKEETQESTSPPPSQSAQGAASSMKTTNQAYFCRKCYKVFFKLDEFNIHSKNCDYNQFPSNKHSKSPAKLASNGEVISPTGRPMRNCVRDVHTYKDESYIPEPAVKEVAPSQQSFVCFICNTPFPTIYSRNSHMRIHKGETTAASNQHRPPQKVVVNNNGRSSLPAKNSNYPVHKFEAPVIKQEPLEPEVQIHESTSNYTSNSIGSVSITPISKNPNQKPTINPNIMRLVQNNPHLTIKANTNQSSTMERGERMERMERMERLEPVYTSNKPPSASNMMNIIQTNNADSDKTYKCSSCWEAFTNKSHLYFHKKNQCEGSKYPCPFCKKRFGTEAAYSSHIFYSHPE